MNDLNGLFDMNKIVPILVVFTLAIRAMEAAANPVSVSVTNAPVPVIGSLEATNFYGQDVVVTGKVAQVSVRSDITFINLDQRYPESPFAVVILQGRSKFNGDATVLRGHSIEIKGKVTKYH